MAKKIEEIDIDTSEEDIRAFLNEVAINMPSSDANQLSRRSLEMEYAFKVLNTKQQKKLLHEQNTFNEKLLTSQETSNKQTNETNRKNAEDANRINKKLVSATQATVVVALLAFIAGMIFNFYQLRVQLKVMTENSSQISFQLMSQIHEELSSKTNLDIFYTIENDQPVLQTYGEVNLISFLNEYETLGSYYNQKLIPIGLVCSWFGDDFSNLFSNKEIVNYINQSKSENPTYYSNLIALDNALNNTKCPTAISTSN